MIERQELYFELSDSGDFVRLEPIERIHYDSDLDWDHNWVKTRVTVNGGCFSGQYSAEFMTVDFETFRKEFSRLYDNLKGNVNFSDLEGYLQLKIVGDGIGHFEVQVTACDKPGIEGSELNFTINFDQTYLKQLEYQLEKITEKFPPKNLK